METFHTMSLRPLAATTDISSIIINVKLMFIATDHRHVSIVYNSGNKDCRLKKKFAMCMQSFKSIDNLLAKLIRRGGVDTTSPLL